MSTTFIITIKVSRDENYVDVDTLPVYEVGNPPVAQEVMTCYMIREVINDLLFRGIKDIDPDDVIKRAKTCTEEEMVRVFLGDSLDEARSKLGAR